VEVFKPMYAVAHTAETVDSRILSVEKIYSLVGPTATSKSIELKTGENAVGRSGICAVRLNNSLISRVHAVLSIFNDQIVVRDCNSTNGTFLNGNRLTGAHILRNGDRIRFAHLEYALVVR